MVVTDGLRGEEKKFSEKGGTKLHRQSLQKPRFHKTRPHHVKFRSRSHARECLLDSRHETTTRAAERTVISDADKDPRDLRDILDHRCMWRRISAVLPANT